MPPVCAQPFCACAQSNRHAIVSEATQSGTGWASARVLAPGTRLADRYTVSRFIASGGMGEVYAATDSTLGEEVALKVLRPGVSAQLDDEVRLARKVTHPGVCRVFDLSVHRDAERALPFVTMELIDGVSLSNRLRSEGKLGEREVLRVATAVSEALAAAHRAGVVHGDLKPANVLVTPAGRVVITDFGLARASDSSRAADRATPAYLAPEQVEGLPPTPASDVYALGVMVYELSTGALPFDGGNTTEAVRKRLTDAPALAQVPRSLRALVAACLERDPARRPTLPLSLSRPPWKLLLLVPLAALAVMVALTDRAAEFEPQPVTITVKAELGSAAPGDWYERAIALMARRAFERTRWFRTRDGAAPLELRVEGTPGALHVVARFEGRESAVEAPSVSEALKALVPRVLEGAGRRGDAPASATERREMKAAGATSLVAWRAYEDCDDWDTYTSDNARVINQLVDAKAHDPGWARLWARLIIAEGSYGPLAKKRFAEAIEAVEPGRDRIGDMLLHQLEAELNGAPNQTEQLRVAASEAPRDLIPSIELWVTLFRENRHAEADAVMRRLYHQFPEKQFGSNVVGELVRQGRTAEAAQLMREWDQRAPGVAQHLLTAINTAAREDPRAVDGLIERLFTLHGRRPELVCVVLESLLILERFSDVRSLGSEIVHSDPLNSARTLYLYSVASTVEGNLGAAQESLLAAIALGSPYGGESWTTQTLTAIARLDRIAGRRADEAAHLEQLAAAARSLGDQTFGAIALEARLTREGPAACEAVSRQLERPPATSVDVATRRHLVRVAHRFGCVDCSAVLREGTGLFEPSTEALLIFGRCARAAGDLATARRALTRASEVTTGARVQFDSPFDRMLARLELAQLAEAEGQLGEATRLYEAVLDRWDRSEVHVPELDAARLALKTLKGAPQRSKP